MSHARHRPPGTGTAAQRDPALRVLPGLGRALNILRDCGLNDHIAKDAIMLAIMNATEADAPPPPVQPAPFSVINGGKS